MYQDRIVLFKFGSSGIEEVAEALSDFADLKFVALEIAILI